MGDILYRDIQEKDYNTICDMIDSAFGLNRYIQNKNMLEQVKKMYIYSCLSEATFTKVAQKDDEIVGIIMGNSKAKYKASLHIKYILNYIKYTIKIRLYSLKHSEDIKGYESLHKIYAEFLKRHKGEFDGVLTLFIVKEGFRGFGIGKALLNYLLDYLKENNTSNIYLYTDTTCNYKFYENNGFKRLEKENLKLIRDNKYFNMDVFLYGYKF